MTRPRDCCLLLLLTLLSACFTPDKPGSGLYYYVPVTSGDSTISVPGMNAMSFLELRSDGSYSQDFGHFDYGNWMLKDDRLYLTNQHHRTYIYLVNSRTSSAMDVTLDGGKPGHLAVHPMPSSREEKDPFSKFNNQWRIPATHKETDAEIRQRLFDHCRFWTVYLTYGQDKENGSLNVTDIPSPLKIYANGLGLKHFDMLPPAWKSYFYDSSDCRRADTMIKHTFRRHEIAWPKTTDEFKRLIGGTEQVQQWFK